MGKLIDAVAQAIEAARPCPATEGCGAYRSRNLHCPDCPHSDAWEAAAQAAILKICDVLDENYGEHPTADWLRRLLH